MANFTQPLREERKELLPHAQAEEAALYPVVGKVMSAPDGSGTTSRDHFEVDRLIDERGAIRPNTSSSTLTTTLIKDLRRVQYGLYALVHSIAFKEKRACHRIAMVWTGRS